MPLLYIILVFVIVGVLLYAINRLIPMDATVKKILNIVVVVVLIIWFLKVIGAFEWLGAVKV